MGFKRASGNVTPEEKFVDSARGETSQRKKNLKRDKTFQIYFTEDELDRVRMEAQDLGMGVNQYMRFKIFSK